MNFFMGILGALAIGGGVGIFLGAIGRFLAEQEILYYWETVVAGLSISSFLVLFAPKCGFKLNADINVAIVFANIFVGMFGAPVVFSMIQPEIDFVIPPIILQIGIPATSFIVLISVGLSLVRWEKTGAVTSTDQVERNENIDLNL